MLNLDVDVFFFFQELLSVVFFTLQLVIASIYQLWSIGFDSKID
jgi:hypothetical protein